MANGFASQKQLYNKCTRYYVYYSYEEFGRGYIGCRRCECSPEEDAYFGSYRDTSFSPTHKVILQEYETYEEALAAEVALHSFFDVAANPHFANKAKQTTTSFTTHGTKASEVTRKKMSASHRERIANGGSTGTGMLGKRHSEETKKKMSEATKKQTYSEATRKKMSESAKKRKPTAEEKVKIAKTLREKPSSQCPICGKMLKLQYFNRHIANHGGQG